MNNIPNLGVYGYVPSPAATIAAPASKDYLSIALIIAAVVLAAYLGYRFSMLPSDFVAFLANSSHFFSI